MITIINKRNSKNTEDEVYIGRPSIAGNPFQITKEHSRDDVIKQYREWLPINFRTSKKLQEFIIACQQRHLSGEHIKLVCYCAPLPCHGDVIKEFIEAGLFLKELER